MSSQALASAISGASTSAPRSNRYEASVDRPRRFDVRLTLAGWKYALSMAMVRVSADTSDPAPPITPATACARVAMSQAAMPGLCA